MKKTRIAVLALVLALMIPFTVLAETAPAAPNATTLSFSTKTLEGKAIDSSIIKKYDLVLVNIWGEWCGPCCWEIPYLQQVHKNYPNVLVLGVWYGNSVTEALKVAKENNVTYPMVHPAGTLQTILNATHAFPTTYFYDKNGKQLGEPDVGARDYGAWATIIDQKLANLPKDPEPVGSKPLITKQPKSASVKAGQKVTFKVAATGGDGLSYQWYYRKSSNESWKKVSKATSATYTFKAKASQSGYQYRCQVKNAAGKVTSKTVTLKIKK